MLFITCVHWAMPWSMPLCTVFEKSLNCGMLMLFLQCWVKDIRVVENDVGVMLVTEAPQTWMKLEDQATATSSHVSLQSRNPCRARSDFVKVNPAYRSHSLCIQIVPVGVRECFHAAFLPN